MSVYTRDILNRLPQLLATCNAVFGSVLKIDSMKKVCKKLQGLAAGSASWCKNVGNERGEVLISVLMESEGLEDLHPMATGLIERLHFHVLNNKFMKSNPDTRRPGRIPHNSCTLTGTVATSMECLGVHSCSWSGIICNNFS